MLQERQKGVSEEARRGNICVEHTGPDGAPFDCSFLVLQEPESGIVY